jgi:integrase
VGSTRARVGQDGSTRYVALYRDLRGRQRSAGTFPTAKQADKAWQRAEALVESGRLGDLRRGRQTFRTYVETWLPAHQIEASTRERYTYMIDKHVMPEFGATRMIDILPEHIRDWIAKQKTSGLSASTIAGNKTILSAIFTTALTDQVVFLHPCAGVKTPTVARKPRVIVTPEQYDAIHHALPGDATRLLVETAIESGLRWGELTELRPADLDLHSRMLTVSRAVTETTAPADGTRFEVKAYPKDKEYRRLKLSAAVCTALREHIARNKLDRTDLLFPHSLLDADTSHTPIETTPAHTTAEATQPIGRTEPNDRGRSYPHGTLTAYTLGRCRCPHCKTAFATYRADRRAAGKDDPRGTRIVTTDGHLPRRWFRHHIWTPATTAAQLPVSVRFHDLRHAHASWLLAGGADIQTVKERLGHGSLRTTEKYLHTLPDTDNTALEAMNRIRHRIIE